ncbi:hypothetical protein C8A03DRAFT_12597 [Achaetomium macrosporum]|uniref:DUF6590 domain-containing protein n=1 Tax=Achaetomium macrosporum TaxID=79813 RepID=A0AAN7HHV2_9PEZI|nr:hypothetical protein C8A03DRAFT_12597 [Achaetomium macrosporum]
MDQGRRNRWGPWTDWTWDNEHARYWRARQDTQGNFDYDFYDPNAPGPAAVPGAVPEAGDPRTPADDLAGSMHRLDLGGQDAQYTQDGAYTYYGAQVAAGGDASAGVYGTASVPIHATSAKGTRRPFEAFAKSKSEQSKHHRERKTAREKGSSSRKHQSRQGKGHGDGHQPPDPAAGQFEDLEAFYPSPAAPPGTSPDDGGAVLATDHVASSAHPDSEAESPDSGEYSRRGYAPEVRLRKESASDYYSTAEPVHQDNSTDQLDDVASQADPYLTGAPGPFYSGGEPSSMTTTDNYSNPAFEYGDGRATPKPTVQPSMAPAMINDYQYGNSSWNYGRSREPSNDDVFTVEPSSRFQPGEVFKIMWCEPLGATGSRKSEIITNQVQLSVEGRQFYQGLRRFIIVANDEGHCTCVPILTYERQACTKRGVKPLKHGIVYQTGKKPRQVNNEPPLGFPPVRVDLYERTEQLVKESRVNYAKLTTVEHNFKVFFIGRVAPEDFGKVVAAVDECWERKRRRNNHN